MPSVESARGLFNCRSPTEPLQEREKDIPLTHRLLELKGMTEQGGFTRSCLWQDKGGDLSSVPLYSNAGGQHLL